MKNQPIIDSPTPACPPAQERGLERTRTAASRLPLPAALKIPAHWLDRCVLAAVVLACASNLSMNVADPDLFGHVQYGRDALSLGLPLTTTYSYAAQGTRWINHEILAEYALALCADRLGEPGLVAGKCLLGMVVVGLILWRARRQGASFLTACVLALLVARTLASHWALRPQLASYVSFALLLALLSHCFAGWEGRWQVPIGRLLRLRGTPAAELPPLQCSLGRLRFLWLAPLLFIVWTNSHGGFLAGLCVFWAYLGLRSLEALAQQGWAATKLVLGFIQIGAAAGLATVVNPYGPLFHVWLYNDLSVSRPEITEWLPPHLGDLQTAPFWILATVACVAVAATRRSRDFTQLVILALILWQALEHLRHIAFFAIACGWWLPLHIDSLLARFGIGRESENGEQSDLTRAFSPRLQWALAAMLVIAVGISACQLSQRLTTLKIPRDKYPVNAAEYIARHRLAGKMVCTFDWSQYILATFGARQAGQPGIQVQIDGRCRTAYSQELLDMHFDFIIASLDPHIRYRDPKSGPFDPARVLNDRLPDLVLISRAEGAGARIMQGQQADWVLLYQDGLAQLWGRRARYDDPSSDVYIPPAEREISESAPRGYVRWPGAPKYEPPAQEAQARTLPVSPSA